MRESGIYSRVEGGEEAALVAGIPKVLSATRGNRGGVVGPELSGQVGTAMTGTTIVRRRFVRAVVMRIWASSGQPWDGREASGRPRVGRGASGRPRVG